MSYRRFRRPIARCPLMVLCTILLTSAMIILVMMVSMIYEPPKQTIVSTAFQATVAGDFVLGHSVAIDLGRSDPYNYPPTQLLRRNSTLFKNFRQFSNLIKIRYANRLMEMKNFEYKHVRSNICQLISDTKLSLVIMIHSATDHFEHRRLIRQTWASVKMPDVQIIPVFILGQPLVSSVQSKIDSESSEYGDIVEGNFADTYHNLTTKHLLSLRWAVEFCPTANFLLKIDDDAFLDLYAVIQFLQDYKWNAVVDSKRNFLACSLFPKHTLPKRSGKWRLSFESYPYQTFPSYCSGVGYFLTPDVAFDLFEAAHRVRMPIIPIDDVFVTGLLVSSLPGLRPTLLNSRFVYDSQLLRNWLQDSTTCPSRYLIGDIGTESDWQNLSLQLWNKTKITWSQNQCKS